MATRNRYEEAIRLYVETAGDDELGQLVKSFQELGDVADAEAGAAREALEGIADASERAAKIDAFAKLKTDLVAIEADLEQAQKGAQAFFSEFKTGDSSSAAITKLQAQARASVNDLTESAEAQRETLQRARAELSRYGIDTRSLAAAQATVNKQLQSSRGALSTAVSDVKRLRTEQAAAAESARQLKARLAEGDAEFRRGAAAKRLAAQALANYRRRADEAAQASARMRGETSGAAGVFSKLRGVAAGAAAFFGFREAGQGVVSILKVAAAAEDTRRALVNLYGSQEAGNRAFEELEALATSSGLALETMGGLAKKLKSFGLDPLNGSLQALVDQNAAVGGTQEDLEGKVLALGQAWAKQKLQGEEILQLVERSVPVWDLLQKVTGKSVDELQKLSEKGALGRDTIKALYEEIGSANSGAAERSLSSLSGLFAQVSARWSQFLRQIADSGVAAYFKREIEGLLGGTQQTESVAKRVSAAIIAAYTTLKSLAQSLAPIVQQVTAFTAAVLSNAEAVAQLVRIWAAFKITSIAVGFAQSAQAAIQLEGALGGVGRAAGGATGPVGKLRGSLAALPKNVVIALGIASVEFAVRQLDRLSKAIIEYQRVQSSIEAFNARQSSLEQRRLQLGQQLQSLYRDFAGQVIQSGEAVGQMTRDQAQDYQFALESARKYYEGVIRVARETDNAQMEATARERWNDLGTAIDGVKTQLVAIADAALRTEAFNAFSNAAIENFDRIKQSGQSAREAASGIFDDLDLSAEHGVGQAIRTFDSIAERGTQAGTAIREELRSAIAAVADDDLPRLRESADGAMQGGSQGAKLFAEELDKINLTRLGVDVEAIKTGFTDAGRTAVDQFGAAIKEVRRLGLTSQQQSKAVSAAFRGAFRDISTSAEIDSIRESLVDAVKAGALSTNEYNGALADLQSRLAEVNQEGQGIATNVEAGSGGAVQGLQELGDQARQTADDLNTVGEAGKEAGENVAAGAQAGAVAAEALSFTLSGVSDRFIELLRTANNRELGIAFRKQFAELNEAIKEAEGKLKTLEEKGTKTQDTFKRFDLVAEDEVQKLLNVENQIDRARKQRAEENQRRLDEMAESYKRQIEAQVAAQAPTVKSEERIVVELVAGRNLAAGTLGGISQGELSSFAGRIAPVILEKIRRARDLSNQPGARTRR